MNFKFGFNQAAYPCSPDAAAAGWVTGSTRLIRIFIRPGVRSAGRSQCRAATHITWPILSWAIGGTAEGEPETQSTHSVPQDGQLLQRRKHNHLQASGAKCKIQQQRKRGVGPFESPRGVSHWRVNVDEMLEELIKDTCPPFQRLQRGTERHYSWEKTSGVFFMGLSTPGLFWGFYETQAELLVSSLVRLGRGRNGVTGGKGRGEEGWEEMRGHSGRGEPTDRYGNEVKGGDRDTNFSLTSSLYLPFKKRGSEA